MSYIMNAIGVSNFIELRYTINTIYTTRCCFLVARKRTVSLHMFIGTLSLISESALEFFNILCKTWNNSYLFFISGKSPSAASSLKRIPIYTSRTVAGTIKKFDSTPDNKSINNVKINHTHNNCNNNSQICHNDKFNNTKAVTNFSNRDCTNNVTKHVSRVDKIVEKLSNNDQNNKDGNLTVSTPIVRYRSPSPSLLRKTQAVIAKEKCNEYYMTKQALRSPVCSPKIAHVNNSSNKVPCPNSPSLIRKGKPKSESFQKAAAFWNLS